ncbi:formate dehydrogenase accessory protein [Skermanella stibiiresistens SB22]|uniref:Sulfur carrier protein FdhD n=1 Tax=Skermanella stibiiresistens SB22 TaxID=1385369 RepID=W9GVR2_9PROT|nr:formate dehydrogenase accessory sulfurtransferase FdhD [Skermanella stibiiresistens]EWY36716.1 formate dehydrogenase accessory protein [Skermanella stibiiresistens SB22]
MTATAATVTGGRTSTCSTVATGSGFRAGGGAAEAVMWQVPEEVPVAILYNGRSHAVMMATPADLEDFAVGFSLGEEILNSGADVQGVTVETQAAGISVDLAVDKMLMARRALRKRSMEGRSGCGLCGAESLEGVIRKPRPVRAGFEPTSAAVLAAFAGLPGFQAMNRANRSVHAAAWCDPSGRILLAREDVGRHNALDKMIGAIVRGGLDPSSGFAVMTSRCSFELVQKAAAVGIPLLATFSAPTSLALDLARQAGMVLGAMSRAESVVLFH